MDGFIKIGTKIDESGMDKGIKDLEKKIDIAEREKIEIEAKIKVTEDAKNEISKQIDELSAKADALSFKMSNAATPKGATVSLGAMFQKDYDSLVKQIDSLRAEEDSLNQKLEKQLISHDKINNRVDSYKNKISSLELKNFENQLNTAGKDLKKSSSFASQLSNVLKNGLSTNINFQKSTNGISKAMSGIISNVKKWGFALVGIRSAYTGIRKLMSTLQSYNKQISTDMQYIGFAITKAFEPIINVIVSGLYKVLGLVNQISVILTGVNIFKNSGVSQFQKAMANAAGSSKQINNNLAKFDDLDVLKKDDSAGTPSTDLSKNGLFSNFTGDAYDFGYMLGEKLTQALESIPWEKIQAKAKEISTNLAMLFNGLVDGINWDVVGNTIAQGLNTVLIFVYNFLTTFDFLNFGMAIGRGLNSAISNFQWDLLGKTLGAKFQAAIDFLFGFVETFDFSQFGSSLATTINNYFSSINWMELGRTVGDGIIGIFNSISSFLEEVDWEKIGNDIKTFLSSIDWKGILEAVLEVIKSAAGGIDNLMVALFGEENAAVIEGIVVAIASLTAALTALSVVMTIVNVLMSPVNLIILAIGVAIATLVAVIILVCRHWDELTAVISLAVETIKNKVTEIFTKVKNFIKTTMDNIKTTISNAIESVKTAWNNVFNSVKDSTISIFNSIWGAIKNIINSILGGIEAMANGVVNGINRIIDVLNGLSFTIPDWVPEFGGKNFGFNLGKIGTISLPRLAQGAIVARPTQAIIGEAGKEAVLPLENNTEWMDVLIERLVGVMAGWKVEASGSGTWGQFIRFLNLELKKEQKRKGSNYIGGAIIG